jgi:hypothetical protein
MYLNNINLMYIHEKGYRIINNEIISFTGKVLRKSTNKDGYSRFSVRIKSRIHSFKVHRLVAYQLYGTKIFEKGIVVRHLDSKRYNNLEENIAIGTQSDNMMDMSPEKRILNASNPIHNHLNIIKDRKNGMTYSELCHKYDIKSKGTIWFIINKSLECNK